jgi:hypothetical protein
MALLEKVKKLVARVHPVPQSEMVDDVGELHIVSAGLDEFGREVPDPVPVAIPVGMKANPSLRDLIRKMVSEQLFAQAVDAAGAETFDEADDFDIPDDPVDPATPYETEFEGLPIMQMRDKDGVLLPPDRVLQRIMEVSRGSESVEAGGRVAGSVRGDADTEPESKSGSEQDAAAAGGVRDADKRAGAAKK